MMPAVILAGGLGTRLRPLTDRLPKVLVQVQGKPFLAHQLEWLKANGVSEVLLLVGYRGRQIEKQFGDGRRLGLTLRYSYEKTPLGTGGALKSAEALLPEEFLLLNGDTLVRAPFSALCEEFRRRRPLALLTAYENRGRVFANNLALNPEGRVTAYDRHNLTGLTHVDAGVAVFSKRALDFLPAGQRVSLEDQVYPILIERNQLAGFPLRERFYDMGSFAGLETLEAEWEAAVKGEGQ